MKDFMGNGYPCSFIHSASVDKTPREKDEREEERPLTVHFLYVVGICLRIKVCEDFNIRVVYKSNTFVHSSLRLKTPLYREVSEYHL